MSQPSAWQGSLDMLCGIYSAAHILGWHGTGELEVLQDRSFRNLLFAAEELGMFSAKHLTQRGYYDFDLVRIVNHLSPRKRFGLEAIAFTDPRVKALYNRDRRALIKEGAYAIVQEHGTAHWIAVIRLTTGRGYECFDPSRENTTSQRQRVRWDRGVLLASPATAVFA